MAPHRFLFPLIALLPALPAGADERLEEIVVTADLRGRTVDEIPASVTVMEAAEVEGLAVQHFEELTSFVPNLNWSGDGHRARYFQIRGVGELEQYQGAPNPSVGFLIDDIDFSGIGTIATLFDLERIEVLRGPQGSRYGANALAGLIYLRSVEPGPDQRGRVQATVAGDDTHAAAIALGGGLDDRGHTHFRISAERYRGDGFRNNSFLGRDDTNGRDENVVRARVAHRRGESLAVHLSALYADVDNGYDAFALDNGYTMLSDKPGRDAQRSVGLSLRAEWLLANAATLTSVTAFADTDVDFDFDADWGNEASWAPFTYDYVSLSDRKRRTLSQELRFAAETAAGTSWLAGIYVAELDDRLLTTNRGEYFDPVFNFADSLDDTFGSDYRATNAAIFGQADWQIGIATTLSAGLRAERRRTRYADTAGLTADPSETMLGGEISLTQVFDERVSGYVSLARGYKAGGFNLGPVPPGRREFSAEALWSLEAGVRSDWFGKRLRLNAAIFAHRHEQQQVRTSFQLVPGDPASFVFFTDNAATGRTAGLEADVDWTLSDRWQLYARLGLLRAEFDEFRTPQVDLSGRDQAHAPRYTFAIGAAWQHDTGWFARVDVSGRDRFYFDVSHDQRSSAYELVNARMGFSAGHWVATLWVRNAFDRSYAVRGFYFGNEPPDFPATLYTRPGDPRQAGVTIDWRF
ncbi:MAG: TonB-dependent receptor [Woeseiaceae bacterium]|nr:TonB-dependent receptor [Woeseiaceae bacterium]